MIKFRHFVVLLALGVSFGISGQDLPYTLILATTPIYEPLDAMTATSVNNGEVWDDPSYSVPIGFDFPLFDQTISTIEFGNFVGPYLFGNQEPSAMLIPYGADLADRGFDTNTSESPILYELSGTAPNRRFTMEWQNAGFYNELSEGTNVSFVNVKMSLYENGDITYNYGPNSIMNNNDIFDGSTGPVIGFNDSYSNSSGDFGTFFYLQGSPVNPTVVTGTIDDFPFMSISSTPEERMLYFFEPENVSSLNEQQLAAGLKIFPNPVREELKLELNFSDSPDRLTLRLLNALGQEVYRRVEAAVIAAELTIDMTSFPAGLYFLEVVNQQASTSLPIVKE